MKPQVLALVLVVYPQRDAAGAGEDTPRLQGQVEPRAGAVSGELRKKNLLHSNKV